MATALALIILPVSGAWADAGSDFKELLSEHWAEASKERVFFRTDPDTFRMNARLPEFSKAARDRRQAFNEAILTRLKSIPEAALSPTDQVSYKLFKYERQFEAKSYTQPGHRFPITKLFGYHTYFADAPANMSFLKAVDYDRYLISLADFPRYNREMIALLQEGIDTGYTHYCQSMNGYETSISQHIVANPEDSALYGPFVKMPAQMPDDKKAAYRTQGAKLVAEKVIPEFQALYDFYTQKYMKNCRKEVAISALPGGADYYQAEIEYFTTTSMTAQEIHDLGLKEVARIRGEMTAIMKKVGFKGDFKAFLDSLRNDPRSYAKTEQELLGRAALISKDMEGELPKFFGHLPRGTYKIKPGTRGAFYMAPAAGGTTSGTYFLGTSNLKAQPLYTLEALTFHEGVPGHHLQSAVAMELDVPEFRKTLYHSAYGEGWGLYSEFLGKEMGFYQDPYSDFGRLTYETWRAVRLVVDTGMHAFGWSRDKAIQYMLDNTALSEPDVIAEIDRYITWPAQALSYKIGEIKIRALRKKAEDTLGENFDLRAFHDMIIGNGSLPIAILEEVVNQWIADQKKASS
ncbi:DUF885 domain-containing protein [Paremcibacter congregatus]|uniref:DUF885 domain-containing protein n=1 Tax=Paremcibacter congregatus TaxID=2043170 RepID=UPI003A955B7B|tara:strand:+ start:2500 stop:4224 length:1725 start_codon:yes stop_codon:yes gene_type:complete